jgi:hypothetical protein
MFLTLNLVMLKDFYLKNKFKRKSKNKKYIWASGWASTIGLTGHRYGMTHVMLTRCAWT